MKIHITALSKKLGLVLVLLASAIYSFALITEPTVEKKKTINKSVPLKANQRVSIKNSFGSVVVKNYTGSEVKVEVTIIARAATEDRAQAILDHIKVNADAGSTVSFVTEIGNMNNQNGRKGENQGMEINYVVYLPESNPFELLNEFGKSEVSDRTGPTDLTQKFGELVVGSLSNVEQITVEFGSIVAEKIKGGKTTFKYSQVKIKNFSGSIKSTFEFCSKTKIGVTSDVTDINISNSYSDIEINLPEAFNATFDIRTSFGDFVNKTSYKIKDEDSGDDHGPKFDKDFSGQSGTGTCRVKIKSSFGKLKLT